LYNKIFSPPHTTLALALHYITGIEIKRERERDVYVCDMYKGIKFYGNAWTLVGALWNEYYRAYCSLSLALFAFAIFKISSGHKLK
jgi:hypothetical protein